MNIYQRINEVRKKCPFIKKDKKVEGGGYMAVTHDHVTAELREHLIDQGIVIVPRLVDAKFVDSGMTTGKGITIMRYEAKYELDFINMEEPSDKVTVPLEAHANDHGDKAPGKATSYATKYAMLKLFSIESGENEEGRATEVRSKKVDYERVENQIIAADVRPNAGAGEGLKDAQKQRVQSCADEVNDAFSAGFPDAAFEAVEAFAFDNDEKLYLWSLLGSKERNGLKKLAKAKQEKLKEMGLATQP
jgi:hypothetical protein